jgi:hypothetical protein
MGGGAGLGIGELDLVPATFLGSVNRESHTANYDRT